MAAYIKTEWTDPVTNAKGYLVIDTLKGGIASGGTRMRKGLTQKEVARLAHTMTLKMSTLDYPIGGAKAGIDYSPSNPDSYGVLKRFLEAHKPYLEQVWITSDDLGTRLEDIARALNEIGLKTANAYLNQYPEAENLIENLNKALKLTVNSVPLIHMITGYGVGVTTQKALEWLGREVTGATVSIQGFGSVGASAASYFSNAGAKVVAIADIEGTVFCEDGLDIPLLLKAKDEYGYIDRSRLPKAYLNLTNTDCLTLNVDVLVPAAVADVINKENAQDIKAKPVVEGANIPITTEGEKILTNKGIYVIPDFIANVGGLGMFGAILFKNLPPNAEKILDYLKESLERATIHALSQANEEGISPREAAYRSYKTEPIRS